MEDGAKIYRDMMDNIVEMSRNCVAAEWARKIDAKGIEDAPKLNALFSKLTDEERELLARFATDAYMDGMYDLLCDIEWYVDCRDMKITVEGVALPVTKYEGIGNDFIGRRDGWKWPEERQGDDKDVR